MIAIKFGGTSAESAEAIERVALVGDNMRHTLGLAARALGGLADNLNICMISQGASRLNISLVVAAADLYRAVESLHREFFTNSDSRLFADPQVFQ
jgi:aspartate kinase